MRLRPLAAPEPPRTSASVARPAGAKRPAQEICVLPEVGAELAAVGAVEVASEVAVQVAEVDGDD